MRLCSAWLLLLQIEDSQEKGRSGERRVGEREGSTGGGVSWAAPEGWGRTHPESANEPESRNKGARQCPEPPNPHQGTHCLQLHPPFSLCVRTGQLVVSALLPSPLTRTSILVLDRPAYSRGQAPQDAREIYLKEEGRAAVAEVRMEGRLGLDAESLRCDPQHEVPSLDCRHRALDEGEHCG